MLKCVEFVNTRYQEVLSCVAGRLGAATHPVEFEIGREVTSNNHTRRLLMPLGESLLKSARPSPSPIAAISASMASILLL